MTRPAPTFFNITVSPTEGLAGSVIVTALPLLTTIWSPLSAVYAEVFTSHALYKPPLVIKDKVPLPSVEST